MSDLPENDDHELAGQHPPLAPASAAGAAPTAPGAKPGAGLAEHGIRGRAGEPGAAEGATRAPDDATRHFDTAQGRLSYAELAERLAEPLQNLDLRIRASEFAQRPLDEVLLLDFHRELSGELFPDDAGRFRTSAVHVGAHEPPDATWVPGLVRDYTANLAEQLRHVATAEERIIELLAYAEGELLTIHPFRDLNGRISRLWLLELLTRLGLPAVDIAPPAGTFRSRYLAALAAWDRRDRAPLQALWRERLSQPAALNDIALPGCTSTPLASYLKALAVLRLVAEDAEHGDPEAMGYWRDDQFVLRTKLSRDQLCEFFLAHWKPTALVAPWGARSGFYGGDSEKTARHALQAIALTNTERLQPFREAIGFVQEVLKREGFTEKASDEKKLELLNLCRRAFPEDALQWLDACYTLTSDGRRFPPLLGTGGNEGSGSYVSGFAQQVLECVARRKHDDALGAALFARPTAGTSVDQTPGHFSPEVAGGANQTSGFDGRLLTNPWDYLFALEGTLLFASSATRRNEFSAPQVSFPFVVAPHAGGSASYVLEEERPKQAKRQVMEIWLPIWSKPCGLIECRGLFSEGKATLGARVAASGLDFARAIASLGVDRGIEQFQRFGFLMRNGQSFFATALERYRLQRNPDANLISDLEHRDWLSKVQRYARDDNAPNTFRSATRQLDTALFAMTQGASRLTMQSVLRQLGRIEAALSTSAKARESVRQPAPRLSAAWALKADDGSSEFGIAAALAGLSLWNDRRRITLETRRHLAVVGDALNAEGDRAWTPESRLAVWSAGPIEANLAALLHRRRLEAQALGQEGEVLASPTGATCADVEAFLRGDTDDRRIAELLGGLACVDLEDFPPPRSAEQIALPPAFILLKVLFTPESLLHRIGWLPQDKRLRLPAEIPPRLTANQPDAAVRIAWARLRALGVKLPGRAMHTTDFRRNRPPSETAGPRSRVRGSVSRRITR
jgi:CRISPR-associated protein Csx17